jgi:hypothetical protein
VRSPRLPRGVNRNINTIKGLLVLLGRRGD